MKPPMNGEQLRRNQKESHRRDAEPAEVPSLGAHASSVPWVSNSLHAGCVRSQEPAEENPWQLAKDFRLSNTDLCLSVFICGFVRAFGLRLAMCSMVKEGYESIRRSCRIRHALRRRARRGAPSGR